MRVLGIDTETTGLSAVDDRIIELSAVLWDWDCAVPLVLFSHLINPGRSIPPEITKLTGITDGQIQEFGVAEDGALIDLANLMLKADYCMAHNAPFDRGFIGVAFKRNGHDEYPTPWLDTLQDIKYPPEIVTRNLRHLAAEHNFLNPFAHRSLFDVLTMLRIASEYRLDDIVKRAAEPTLYVQALVSFDEKEKAKERGYRWYAPTKLWWRPFKQSDYVAEKDTCGFRTALLEKAPE